MTDNESGIFEKLSELDGSLSADVKMTLVYISGYILKKHPMIDSEDTCFYYNSFGNFLKDLNRGGLTIPGDNVCQWVFYGYIMFSEVKSSTCRKSLTIILKKISEFYDLKIENIHCTKLSNIFFNNHCHLYTPRSSRERKQKVLKLHK